MTELVLLEQHQTFLEASNRARTLAIQHKKETSIRRSASGWEVLVATSLQQQVRPRESSPNYTPGEAEHDYDNEHERDLDRHLITEEFFEDQESWARSDEDGWFYAD